MERNGSRKIAVVSCMVIKKIKVPALICIVGLWLTGCSDRYVRNSYLSLNERGLQLTQKMKCLADDRNYVAYGASSKELGKTVADVARYDYEKPRKVFVIDSLNVIARSIPELSDDRMRPMITEKLLLSVPMQINGKAGAKTLAALSLLFAEDAFLCNGLEQHTWYLYLFDGGYHGMVLFRPYKDHIVVADSYFVTHPLLDSAETIADVKRFFHEVLGIDGMRVSELDGRKSL